MCECGGVALGIRESFKRRHLWMGRFVAENGAIPALADVRFCRGKESA